MMIAALLLGIAAFVLMILYDYLQAYRKKQVSGLFFAGILLLLGASVWLVLLSDLPAQYFSGTTRFFIGAALALIFLLGTVYALFFALPADTYSGAEHECVSHGLYAVCRHPAALMIYGFYAALLLMAPSLPTLLAFLLFPNLNLLYVVLEDRYFFLRTIKGYLIYKRNTPFLIPNRDSLSRMWGRE